MVPAIGRPTAARIGAVLFLQYLAVGLGAGHIIPLASANPLAGGLWLGGDRVALLTILPALAMVLAGPTLRHLRPLRLPSWKTVAVLQSAAAALFLAIHLTAGAMAGEARGWAAPRPVAGATLDAALAEADALRISRSPPASEGGRRLEELARAIDEERRALAADPRLGPSRSLRFAVLAGLVGLAALLWSCASAAIASLVLRHLGAGNGAVGEARRTGLLAFARFRSLGSLAFIAGGLGLVAALAPRHVSVLALLAAGAAFLAGAVVAATTDSPAAPGLAKADPGARRRVLAKLLAGGSRRILAVVLVSGIAARFWETGGYEFARRLGGWHPGWFMALAVLPEAAILFALPALGRKGDRALIAAMPLSWLAIDLAYAAADLTGTSALCLAVALQGFNCSGQTLAQIRAGCEVEDREQSAAQGIVLSTMGAGGLIGSFLVSALLALSGAPEIRWPFWATAAALSLSGVAIALKPGLFPAACSSGARNPEVDSRQSTVDRTDGRSSENVVTPGTAPGRLFGDDPALAAAGLAGRDLEDRRP